MPLTTYRTLGRSGLAVSPLALGTMTFGTARWGSGEDGSRDVFNAYVEAGGNFIDTADVYASGRSEELLGGFIKERNLRDSIVIATKAGFSTGNGVHRGGLSRKHIQASIDASLRRLATDYIDLYFAHTWDGVTPAEELLETMTSLVRAGKIRYWGLSNTPAWYVAQLATLARTLGQPGPIVLQYFYSLVNRDIEDEHMPLASDMDLAIMPWSPLAYGLLTGKYDRATVEAGAPRSGGLPRDAATGVAQRAADDKRLDGANPFGDTLFTDRNWRIVDEVKRVASALGETPARVALQWVTGRVGVTSTLMGVSRAEQVADNVAALDVVLPAEHRAALTAISQPGDARLIYTLFRDAGRQHAVFGGATVHGWAEADER